MILIACVLVACVLLVVLGFVAPRLSRRPQRAVDRGLDKANENAQEAPAPLDKAMDASTRVSREAADAATEGGRKLRDKSEE